MADTLTITRPDDWHLHLRDGAALAVTVPATALSESSGPLSALSPS